MNFLDFHKDILGCQGINLQMFGHLKSLQNKYDNLDVHPMRILDSHETNNPFNSD